MTKLKTPTKEPSPPTKDSAAKEPAGQGLKA
jgi:hypothetical protein